MSEFNIKRMLAHSSILMVGRLVGACAAFTGNILIARWYGADALGVVALSLAFMGLLTLFLPLGRQAVGVLFISKYQAQDKPGHIQGFVRSGHRTILLTSVLTAAAVAALFPFQEYLLEKEQMLALGFACLMAPALALFNFNASVINGFRRPLLAYFPDLALKPLLVLMLIIGLVILVPDAKPYILLAAMCAAVWISTLFQIAIVSRIKLLPQEPENLADKKSWSRTARPWIAIMLFSDYVVELHLLFAGLIVAPAEVAILFICFRIRIFANFGLRALYTFVLPEIFDAHARQNIEKINLFLKRGNTLALIYAVLVCLVIFVVGGHLLGFLGAEFAAGETALLIICLTIIPKAVFGPATSIMAADGRQKSMVYILLAGIVLSLGCGLLLFPSLGINAFATGYAISVIFTSTAQWWWAKRLTGIDCSIMAGVTRNQFPPKNINRIISSKRIF